jgi:hypothetical protein
MMERFRAHMTWMIAAGSCFLQGCATDGTIDPSQVPECEGQVTIEVSPGTVPTFHWTPNCTLGRLVVEQQAEEEYWGTETHGTNTYRSPITYGVPPADAEDPHPAQPLSPGTTYRVTLYRWVRVTPPESLEVLGTTQFTPAAEPQEQVLKVHGRPPKAIEHTIR